MSMNDLCYCSASAGGFGLVNFSLRLPQSHVMLVGPQSCGRHTSLGAFMRGYDRRNSYLFLDETDIALGTVDEQIVDAVEETLRCVEARPRVFIVMLTCLPFIAGVDETALIERLHSIHGDIDFQVFLMNPVSAGTNHSPGKILYSRIGELWDKDSGQDGSLNIVGSVIPPRADSDIYEIAEEMGISHINHIGLSKDYDQFRAMGRANWNLLLKSDCQVMGAQLAPRMGYMFSPVSYEPRLVEDMYRRLSEMTGLPVELTERRERAESDIDNGLREFKGVRVALGSSATMRTFGMARMLLSRGVEVTDIFKPDPGVSPPPGYDAEACEWVRRNHPEIRYHDTSDVGLVNRVGDVCKADLAIGYDAAYFTNSEHVLGQYDDVGMFGFGSAGTFIGMMKGAMDRERDLMGMLYDARLVI